GDVVGQIPLDQLLGRRSRRAGRGRGDGAEHHLLDPGLRRGVDQRPPAGRLELGLGPGGPEGDRRDGEDGGDAVQRGRQARRVVEVAGRELGAGGGQRGRGGAGRVANQGADRAPAREQPPGGGAALLAGGAGDEDRGVEVGGPGGGYCHDAECFTRFTRPARL